MRDSIRPVSSAAVGLVPSTGGCQTRRSMTVAHLPTITVADLRHRLGDPALAIVDVRPIEAYNGWRQGDDARGGHIPGAVAFPAEWFDAVDGPDLDRLLHAKGVSGATDVVVCGGMTRTTGAVEHLAAHGIEQVRILDGGFRAWATDPGLPLERLARHERLVPVTWLAAVLAGEQPEAAPTGPVAVFHVTFESPEEYAAGHIPGAFHLDTNRLEDPADWNRRAPAALGSVLRALGITHDTTVILYGRDSEGPAGEGSPARRAGQLAAMRAALILHYVGVDDVRVLDGGFDRWVRAGRPLETALRAPSPVGSFGARIPVRPEVIVDLEGARQILADPDGAALVSVRSWREHVGDVSGYDYIRPAGHIKGDVWGNGGSDASHMEHYRNVDGTMRAYPEIAADWGTAGITSDQRVAFYCGTGWRASEAWFAAHLQGWDRVAVYDGGWFEWSRDPRNPIEIGSGSEVELDEA